MKRFLIMSALASTLVACGGSSDSGVTPPPPPPPPTNAEPSMSGTYSQTVKAAVSTDIVFSASDADGDELTISIDNAPSWLNYTFESNELTVSVEPGFFDIAEHSVDITLSDGTASKGYSLKIEVEDNPSAWGDIELTHEELTGAWKVSGSETSYNLFVDGRGVMSHEDTYSPLDWQSSDGISVNVLTAYCTEACDAQYNETWQIVAQQENKIRVSIGSGDSVEVVELTKADTIQLTDYYTSTLEPDLYAELVTFNGTEQDNVTVNIGDFSFGRYSYTNLTGSVIGQWTQSNDKAEMDSFANNQAYSLTINVENSMTCCETVQAEFAFKVRSVTLNPGHNEQLIQRTVYDIEWANAEGRDPQHYETDGQLISEVLGTVSSEQLLIPIEKVSVPSNLANKTWLGPKSIRLDEGALAESELEYGGQMFSFSSETAGELLFSNLAGDALESASFSWQNNGDDAILTVGSVDLKLEFFMLPNDQLAAAIYHETYAELRSFVEYNPPTYTSQDYQQTFYDVGFNDLFDDQKTVLDFSDSSPYTMNTETNGSLTWSSSLSCSDGETFEQCLTRVIDSGQYVLIRNVEFFDRVDDKYHAIYKIRLYLDGALERGWNSRRIYQVATE
ncbi:hypothetical protein [Thalassotalea agarivorans]|uniref:Dystroglycan-type cadherin-like domain-containing protein n=1 Tax=Thalassotalea agarivorans TaxID=349064 RepID=A0A1H9YPR6_THASX|nr:hypothetical protein [Thalassotalea agarivorans]SES71061.1 hypothetical protein SAMN05660429_00305 [Thalassotalea agarivorans]